MGADNMKFLETSHKKFAAYKALSDKFGPDQAWEKMLVGYPEQQKARMGPFLSEPTLAQGFAKAAPFFNAAGMDMSVVDISNKGVDAVLEIQRVCPYLEICKEHGFDAPCRVICEMDIEASRRAFPEMKGEILSRQASGSCACVFKYERAGKR